MIIQLTQNASPKQQEAIIKRANDVGYKTSKVETQKGQYLIGIGSKKFDIRNIGQLEGVKDIHIVSDSYQLVSSKWKVSRTEIDLGDGVKIGDGSLSLMAGPCSIEGEKNIEKTLDHLQENDIRIMRGGVYKPRSSPYSFRGLGQEGLKMWHNMASERGIKIITEVMQVSQIPEMVDFVDIFQVGARNTQNFNLLDELGKVDKPVMIKRGISGTIDELLHSAEYVFSSGNEKVLLCERGIRTFETQSRNTFDINAIPILKEKSHLPVIADPSHGIGVRKFVDAVAMASIAAGADGVIFETHDVPEKAFSDGQQTLDHRESSELIKKLRLIKETVK